MILGMVNGVSGVAKRRAMGSIPATNTTRNNSESMTTRIY